MLPCVARPRIGDEGAVDVDGADGNGACIEPAPVHRKTLVRGLGMIDSGTKQAELVGWFCPKGAAVGGVLKLALILSLAGSDF